MITKELSRKTQTVLVAALLAVIVGCTTENNRRVESGAGSTGDFTFTEVTVVANDSGQNTSNDVNDSSDNSTSDSSDNSDNSTPAAQ